MPRHSEKEKLLEIVLLKGTFDILTAKNGHETNEAFWDTVFNVQLVQNFRYSIPRSLVPKSMEWYKNVLPNYDDFRFKCSLRVTREEFAKLLALIEGHKVFKTEGRVMVPTELQLAVALYRFGSSGSGSSYMNVGHLFGLSDCGIIIKCTNRVIKALISLQAQFICWPSVQERLEIVEYMDDKLPGCVGFIDGTHVNLFQAPLDDHEAYFSRKQLYGLQVQAICDYKLVIRHVFVGFPASVHDARVFANSKIGSAPQEFFAEGQWLAGDSAYQLSRFMCTPFRDNARTGTASQRRKFNKHFSSHRVNIEKVFGIMKAKFESLRCLRVRVDKEKGHERACKWILAVCIIYNILRPEEDVEVTQEEDREHSDEHHAENGEGDALRQKLFEWFINHQK